MFPVNAKKPHEGTNALSVTFDRTRDRIRDRAIKVNRDLKTRLGLTNNRKDCLIAYSYSKQQSGTARKLVNIPAV